MNPKDKLINILNYKFKAKLQSNGVWYNISCPFCGDSPNPNTRHCNIRVSPNDDFMLVHCFQPKCTASGILSQKHLADMGVFDTDITEFVSKNRRSTEVVLSERVNLKREYNLDGTIIDTVLEYFYKRTKMELTKEIVDKFRIVHNVPEFINDNKDRLPAQVYDRLIRTIEKNIYIGFLNDNGTQLELRAITEVDKANRFVKVSLVDDKSIERYQINQLYTVEKGDNLYLDESTYLVFCEGKFDLINTYNYIIPDVKAILTSSAISSMKQAIGSITKLYPAKDIIYVADADIDDKRIYLMFKNYKYRFRDLYVVRNKVSKDVGDLSLPMEPYKYKYKFPAKVFGKVF